jgi:beta-glucanase (GH16 family)
MTATKFLRRTALYLVACGMVVASSTGPNLVRAPKLGAETLAAGGWSLEFVDDFSDGLDAGKWATCYWWARPDEGCANGSSGELQWYRPQNVRAEDNHLSLIARREDVRDASGSVRPFTSGIVSGAGRDRTLFSFQYGYAEARVRVPAGQALWSAFWMLPVSREPLPEIDVFEAVGGRNDEISVHTHFDDDGTERDIGRRLRVRELDGVWHTFGVLWERDRLTWYVDDIPRQTITTEAAIPHEPMYLLLNLAVGGTHIGEPDSSTPFPSSFDVDYVKVWRER